MPGRISPVFLPIPVVWITGASKGIGEEIAKQFAAIGCAVALSARSARELTSLRNEIVSLGGVAYAYPCDVANPLSVLNVARRIVKSIGPVDVLVNNAGVTVFKSFDKTSLKEFEQILSINLSGTIHAIKTVLPHMRKKKGGWIVNILSTAALKTFTDSSAYSISKTGIRTLGNVLREEVRHLQIKVTNVYPGPTDTAMWSEGDRRKFRSRMMTAKSVAETVLALYRLPPDVVVEEIVLCPIEGDID
jgi:short-subunit dehydrogenase